MKIQKNIQVHGILVQNTILLQMLKSIVEQIIRFWGSGKMKIKKNKFYEQPNLQLNISKAMKKLNGNLLIVSKAMLN